jgi:hypothetical protein
MFGLPPTAISFLSKEAIYILSVSTVTAKALTGISAAKCIGDLCCNFRPRLQFGLTSSLTPGNAQQSRAVSSSFFTNASTKLLELTPFPILAKTEDTIQVIKDI